MASPGASITSPFQTAAGRAGRQIGAARAPRAIPRTASFWEQLLKPSVCVIAHSHPGRQAWVRIRAGLVCHHVAFGRELFIWIFYVQHIFEGTLPPSSEAGSQIKGHWKGTSYLQIAGVVATVPPPTSGYHTSPISTEGIPRLTTSELAHHRHADAAGDDVPQPRFGATIAPRAANFILGIRTPSAPAAAYQQAHANFHEACLTAHTSWEPSVS